VSAPAFLLDTNICIDILRDGAGHPAVRLQHQQTGTVLTSAITAAELMLGAARGGAAAMSTLDLFFARVPVLPFEEAAARAYAGLPFRRGSFDRLIAAHALALDLTLVTANTRDFADVPGLRLEDWTRPS